MRRSSYLITDIRRETENAGVSTTTAGQSDETLLNTLNSAQTWLLTELEKVNASPFTQEAFIDVTAGTSGYALPRDTYLGSDIVNVWYSSTPSTGNYTLLPKASLMERTPLGSRSTPCRYYVRNNYLYLDPTPSVTGTSAVRLNYTKRLPRIDKRRAKLTAVTVSSGQVTALTVDLTDYATHFPGESSFSSSRILVDDYFSVVSASGTVKATGIPITAINSGTGAATITSYTPISTSETAAVGDYLVAGTYASSHSQLPDEAEPFLIEWSKAQLFDNDGNPGEASAAKQRTQLLGAAVVSAWSRLFDDVEYVAIIDRENT